MKYCSFCGQQLIKLPLGGRERSACPDIKCGFVHWNNPIPVVAAIVEHDGDIALIQNVGWPDNWFGLVTGFLESGEMPAEAVLREVEEEIGLQATLFKFVARAAIQLIRFWNGSIAMGVRHCLLMARPKCIRWLSAGF